MIMVEYDRPNVPRSTGHYGPHHGSPHHQHHLDKRPIQSTPSPPYQYASIPTSLPGIGTPQGPTSVRSTTPSYPSPASYPSPSISAYQYPPTSAPPPTSRGSPYHQPTNGLSLPPIRLSPTAHEGSPLLGSQLPPPQQQHYYSHPLPPPSVPHITSAPMGQGLRYPLPAVGTERIMSGGRHKKEIKRRTKTGCLTCRKRRIKCDEGHPTCKNCQKSKRDCLGYDPIFKSQPGPAAIQPAPSGGPLPAATSSAYGPITSMPPGYSSAMSTAASSPVSSCDTFDYPPVDPVLDATSHPHLSAPPSLQDPYRSGGGLKRPLDLRHDSPFSSVSDTSRPPYSGAIPPSSTPNATRSDYQNSNPAKRIKIDDLLSGTTAASAPPLSPPSSDLAVNVNGTVSTSIESMRGVFGQQYAPAVDAFLEVEWFGSRGLHKLMSDHQLAEVMASVFERLKARGGSYLEEEDPVIRKSGMDTDLLWAGIRLSYGTRIPESDNRSNDRGYDDRSPDLTVNDVEGKEAQRRINTIEALLSRTQECTPPSPGARSSPRPGESSSAQFWDTLEEIVRCGSRRGNDQAVVDLLRKCNQLVDGKLTRELLYNIAEHQYLKGEDFKGEDFKVHREALRARIEGIANDRNLHITRLDRRIAGRAMGLWTQPLTDIPFCMTAASSAAT